MSDKLSERMKRHGTPFPGCHRILAEYADEVSDLEAELERAKDALDYLAIDCESGMIETECDEDGVKLSREEHDNRIAKRCRAAFKREQNDEQDT